MDQFRTYLLSLIILLFNIYGNYDFSYYEYSKKINQPDAVAILAHQRPHYFKKLLASIEKNKEAASLPFFFFLDGGNPQAQAENILLIQQSTIQNKEIIIRPVNYGCPKNHIDSKRFLFDWCCFDRVIVMEEDLEVSQNYFTTLLHLDDWAHSNYINIGTVQLWSKCKLNYNQKKPMLSRVRETVTYHSMVTYAIRKKVWQTVASILYDYEKFIDPLLADDQYHIARSKPIFGPTAKDCQQWVLKLVDQCKRQESLHAFSSSLPIWPSKAKITHWFPTENFSISQDKMTSLILWLAGYTRLQTTVNRVSHIGNIGISSNWTTPPLPVDEFPEDPMILEFESE